jgi:exodeoxyribonuclease-5
MIRLTPAQERAIDAISSWYHAGPTRGVWREFYLAGYAGSGKSTITEEAIHRLRDDGCNHVITGAYTGKAAYVLRNKGNANAKTIHSMIYSPVECPRTGDVRFELDPDGDASTADMIVLDECSMINEDMARDIRSFGKPILVLGDPGQLPPVRGAGAFTNRQPDVFLTEIHRQAAESPIIKLATMARNGEAIPIGEYGPGVRVVPYDPDAGQYVYDPDTQVICGLNRVRHNLTQKMRARLGFSGHVPEPGEAIMCCKNNKELGIFNGQQGTLSGFRPDLRQIGKGFQIGQISATLDGGVSVDREMCTQHLFAEHFAKQDKPPRFDKDVLEFDWGYVLTCHKAQGPQWPRVTIIDDSGSFRDDAQKWLYTAITRAEIEFTLITRGTK